MNKNSPITDLVKFTSDNQLEKRTFSHKNDFLTQVGNLMEEPEFRLFFNEYFKEWSDIKAVLMLMKGYAFIDEEYFERTGKRLSKDEVTAILRKVMMDSDCRHLMVKSMDDFMKHEKGFNDKYRQLLTNHFQPMIDVDKN